jgi:hypothetical protein
MWTHHMSAIERGKGVIVPNFKSIKMLIDIILLPNISLEIETNPA